MKPMSERHFAILRRHMVEKIGIHVDQQYKGNVYQQGEYAGFDAT